MSKYQIPGKPPKLIWPEEFVGMEPHKPVILSTWDVKQSGREESDRERQLRMLVPLSQTCLACTMCERGRVDARRGMIIRDQHVLSNMNPTSVMVVGYQPEWGDLETRVTGKTWEKFNKALSGVTLDDFYITTLMKCYSEIDDTDTTATEICSLFLRMEIGLIKPKLVVALGKVVSDYLTEWPMVAGTIRHSEEFGVKVMFIDTEDNFEGQMSILCRLVARLNVKGG